MVAMPELAWGQCTVPLVVAVARQGSITRSMAQGESRMRLLAFMVLARASENHFRYGEVVSVGTVMMSSAMAASTMEFTAAACAAEFAEPLALVGGSASATALARPTTARAVGCCCTILETETP